MRAPPGVVRGEKPAWNVNANGKTGPTQRAGRHFSLKFGGEV